MLLTANRPTMVMHANAPMEAQTYCRPQSMKPHQNQRQRRRPGLIMVNITSNPAGRHSEVWESALLFSAASFFSTVANLSRVSANSACKLLMYTIAISTVLALLAP